MWRDLSKTLRELLEMPADAGAYRPDLHYMRGPGPKWHAKYDGFLAQTVQIAAPDSATVHELTERRA
jgi:hypothetical protein